jgi:hypothetical protein
MSFELWLLLNVLSIPAGILLAWAILWLIVWQMDRKADASKRQKTIPSQDTPA